MAYPFKFLFIDFFPLSLSMNPIDAVTSARRSLNRLHSLIYKILTTDWHLYYLTGYTKSIVKAIGKSLKPGG